MAKSYIDFEVSKEVQDKTLDALRLARQGGNVRKGVNEVTKSVERGLASLVVIAADVEPEEVVMHIPTLCKQKNIAYVFVPSKLELGKAIGMNVACSSVAVEKTGSADAAVKDVVARITGKSSASGESQKTQEKKEQKPQQKKESKPKKEQQASEPVKAPEN